MRVILERLDQTDQGTFGRISAGGLTLFTGELPWRDNLPNISCIPVGIYQCRYTYSPHFKKFLFLVDQVPDRSGVRIHAANLMGSVARGFHSQLNGCIALGEKLGLINKQKALLLSAPAMRRFETHMKYKPFTLEIVNA
jgi:hypothetical protein